VWRLPGAAICKRAAPDDSESDDEVDLWPLPSGFVCVVSMLLVLKPVDEPAPADRCPRHTNEWLRPRPTEVTRVGWRQPSVG
jgi:hypothetical protein